MDSPGGSLFTALQIGNAVQDTELDTVAVGKLPVGPPGAAMNEGLLNDTIYTLKDPRGFLILREVEHSPPEVSRANSTKRPTCAGWSRWTTRTCAPWSRRKRR